MTDTRASLPRLLYLADVPVEASYHGSALVYRLLEGYPPDRLRVMETNLMRSIPERRLPSVAYSELLLGPRRPLHTRFSRWYAAWLTFRAIACTAKASRLLTDFLPDAVLSVSHGFSWRTAARFAADRHLPLHLISHDDLPRLGHLPDRLARWIDAEFGRVYRQAQSRLCVSPFMAETYYERYGVTGTVLLPSRAADAPVFFSPPERLRRNDHPLTYVFAGTINSTGYVRVLRALADALLPLRARLLLFGPLTPKQADDAGLVTRNVEVRGMLRSADLIQRCRDEADVLFLPMSFAETDKTNMQLSFPSKLTDYTLMGLPLLIQAPHYSSVVRWTRDNPGVAEVVDTEDSRQLTAALQRLKDPQHRIRLAVQALAAGNRFFSHTAAQTTFHVALQQFPSNLDSRGLFRTA